jgi:hypothetical protein
VARKLIAKLFDLELEETCIFYDNQNCIKLSVNPMWDMVQKGAVRFQYISTDDQVADVLTKLLSRVKFEYFRDKLGVIQKDFPIRGK